MNRKVLAMICMSVVLAVGALSTATVTTPAGEGTVVQALVEGCFRRNCRPSPVTPAPDRGNLDLENETVPPPPAPPAIAAVADVSTTLGVASVIAAGVAGLGAGVGRGWKNQHGAK